MSHCKLLTLALALALSAVGLGTWGGCVVEDPNYCDESRACPAGKRCNQATKSCEPLAVDAGAPAADTGATVLGDAQPDLAQSKSKQLGQGCVADSECDTGYCVDRVCCEARCDAPCRSCSLPGKAGQCSLAAGGQDPRRSCAGKDSACAGTCDGAGACTFPDNKTSCGGPSCSAGKLNASKCDGKGTCVAAVTDCGGYACASNQCGTSCQSTSADCTGTSQCVGGKCVNQLPAGAACGANSAACASGFCVDGVCCGSASCGACKRCDVKGQEGTCSPVLDGTSCGATSCASSTKSTKSCKAGSCVATPVSCGAFLCNSAGTDCLASCTAPADCVPTAYCAATVCAPKKGNGATCASGVECASGSCAAGVCCTSACTGACESCALPGKVGSCSPKPAGTACGGAATCVDDPTASYIATPQCSGTSPACQTVKLTCGAYKCTPGAASCRTACQANSECSSALCDLLDAKSTCVPAAAICYTNAAVTGGNGSQTAPLPSIGQCLASGKLYVAVADGIYNENLSLSKTRVHIYALAPQPSVYGGGTPTVKLRPNKIGHGIEVLASGELFLRGFDVTSAASTIELLSVDTAKATVESCYLHDVNGSGRGVTGSAATIALANARIEKTADLGVYAYNTDLVLQQTRLNKQTYSGVYFQASGNNTAKLVDVEASDNGLDGLHLVGALRPSLRNVTVQRNGLAATGQEVGFGLYLDDTLGGWIGNLLATNNRYGMHWQGRTPSGVGLPTDCQGRLTNATIAYNSGPQLETTTTGVYLAVNNSIIWADSGTILSGPLLKLDYSDVAGGTGGAGTGNIALPPVFVSSVDFHLQKQSSPCVNAGDPAYSDPGATDLDGKPRVVGIVDMGAYEAQ